MPDFLIIGAQKGGTTSLYNYLIQHPQITTAKKKEIHFFDNQFHRGLRWYRNQFPLLKKPPSEREGQITGESSPYYLFHPLAAKRAWETLPQAKIIVLLRDPVDRAYSHYWNSVRSGHEKLSFEEAIEKEPVRLHGERKNIRLNSSSRSRTYQHYSYVRRGFYLKQLRPWLKRFPENQVLIIQSEEFYRQPSRIIQQVTDFLQLPPHEINTDTKFNDGGDYPPMKESTRKWLADRFRPYNERLYEYLGVEFDWT
jgi:hypothetical protein